MTTIPTIHKHPSLTIGKYSYQVYKLGDTPQTSTLMVRRVSNPAIAWTVSLQSSPEYATSCRVAIPKAVYKQALELLTTGRVEVFPLDAPTLTAQTIKPPTPTPTPLRPNLLRTIRINKLINDFPIAARLTKFKVYKARILDCLLEPLRYEALNHCFYYLAVKPTLVRVKSRSAL